LCTLNRTKFILRTKLPLGMDEDKGGWSILRGSWSGKYPSSAWVILSILHTLPRPSLHKARIHFFDQVTTESRIESLWVGSATYQETPLFSNVRRCTLTMLQLVAQVHSNFTNCCLFLSIPFSGCLQCSWVMQLQAFWLDWLETTSNILFTCFMLELVFLEGHREGKCFANTLVSHQFTHLNVGHIRVRLPKSAPWVR
jgi:hypothetical protein